MVRTTRILKRNKRQQAEVDAIEQHRKEFFESQLTDKEKMWAKLKTVKKPPLRL